MAKVLIRVFLRQAWPVIKRMLLRIAEEEIVDEWKKIKPKLIPYLKDKITQWLMKKRQSPEVVETVNLEKELDTRCDAMMQNRDSDYEEDEEYQEDTEEELKDLKEFMNRIMPLTLFQGNAAYFRL